MRNQFNKIQLPLLLVSLFFTLLLSSCERIMGWGVLLWHSDQPALASGTVVPVYIRSNIDKVWVVGHKDEGARAYTKFELPLWQLEFVGSRKAAEQFAVDFSEYQYTYAKTLLDGLPIRASADNNARRVYRLREDQIVKVLRKTEGAPVMSGADPLPGDWLQVLTDDGSIGYSFSYRLKVFESHEGFVPIPVESAVRTEQRDAQLEELLTTSWYPEQYLAMLNKRQVNLELFRPSNGFRLDAANYTAEISSGSLKERFTGTGIQKQRDNNWRLEGSSLSFSLRGEEFLVAQFIDSRGSQRNLIFAKLPEDIESLIEKEKERREELLAAIVRRGPSFKSESYGSLSLSADGRFSWKGFNLLVPLVIPTGLSGTGSIQMRLFLESNLKATYDGALSFVFDSAGGAQMVHFLYSLDPDGLRLEHLAMDQLDGVLVKRRATTPMILFFKRSER